MSVSKETIKEFTERAEVFFKANASLREVGTAGWGVGSDDVSLFPESTLEQDLANLAEARAWANCIFDAGFGWITGPIELGGRGLTRDHDIAFRKLESRYETPSRSVYGIGLGMVAPTMLDHGTPAVTAYLRSMWRGDMVGCQLFSEPGAGSDLASVQTRAVRDGDEWIINGQKVWTSNAHLADIGEILCRTDPDLPKHKGLTAFMVDMHAPGVEVRPLNQATGGAAFNEVFFTDVRIPDDHRLGEVNGGWGVALTTLMNERASIGGGSGGVSTINLSRLIEMARRYGKANDPLVRQQLAAIVIGTRVASYTNMRSMARVATGGVPGPEMSLGKMALTNNLLAVSDLVSSILGPRLVADTGAWGTYAWCTYIMGVAGMRIAGGSDEVLRNIISERVLGLPKDPAPR